MPGLANELIMLIEAFENKKKILSEEFDTADFFSLPLVEMGDKYGITDANGNFIRLAILKKWYLPKELKTALFNELCAQINYLTSLGFKISHADSHQHVHLHYYMTTYR